MAEPNITAIKRKTATQYLFFMLGCYYLVFFTSFLLSLLFINQIIGKFNTGITILILIGFLMLLFIIIGVVIVRFYTSIHTEKWGNLTDKPLFFSSIILFLIFGLFMPVLEYFTPILPLETLYSSIGMPWAIFSVISCLYVLISGWAISRLKNQRTIRINYYISLTPFFINALFNCFATIFIFVFSQWNLELANTFFYFALVFSCLNILYILAMSLLFGIKVLKIDNADSKQI